VVRNNKRWDEVEFRSAGAPGPGVSLDSHHIAHDIAYIALNIIYVTALAGIMGGRLSPD
jgi:hypothetical protein